MAAQTAMSAAQAKSPPHRRERLLALLADGQFHSGEALAKRLRISRSAVWKLINSLRELGVEVQAVQRQGYHLNRAVELYRADKIQTQLPAAASKYLHNIDVLLAVDSTNRFVTDHPPPQAGCASLCVAEIQQAGRGRRGRSWLAPFGSGICLSMGWAFEDLPPAFSALSLVVGVALVRVLHKLGATAVGLKWPNDLLYQGRKLGGVLIELRGESTGPAQVVIGVGLNLRMPAQTRLLLAEKQAALVADLHEILRDRTPERNELVAALTAELIAALREFSLNGFEPFRGVWSEFDALFGSPIKVLTAEQTVHGIARGADAEGALLLDVRGEVQRFVSGEVSVRV
jgi:BirA family transcriptional regulator, biotin operon repressor / biotin---[acetyl-CoA-carboxylase] ligase